MLSVEGRMQVIRPAFHLHLCVIVNQEGGGERRMNLNELQRSRDCRASNRPRIVTKQFQFKITSFPCYVKPSVVATVYPSQPRDKLPESTFFYKVVSDFVRVGSLSE